MATRTDKDTILDLLRDLDPYVFEHLVADLWESEGWKTSVTQQSRDQGVDIRATHPDPTPRTMGIEAKRYDEDNKVGERDVKVYHSTLEDADDLDEFTIVTTGSFTADGKVFAYENDLNLVDGDELVDMILKHERYDLLSQYLDIGDFDRTQAELSTGLKEQIEPTTEVPPQRTKTKIRGRIPALVTATVMLVGGGILLGVAPSGNWVATLGGLGLTVGFFGFPIVVFLDAYHLRKYDANYQPNLWIWSLATFMTMGIVGLWYMIRRLSRTSLREAL